VVLREEGIGCDGTKTQKEKGLLPKWVKRISRDRHHHKRLEKNYSIYFTRR
jgi:hypothetical protein